MNPLLAAFINTIIIYILLLLAFRAFARDVLGELSPLSYLAVALLGSGVETAVQGGTISVAGGLIAGSTLLAANRLISESISRSRRVRRALLPSPLVVIWHGAPVKSSLRSTGVTLEELHSAIRERGYADFGDVRFAIIEPNGSVAVIPYRRHEG